MKLLARLLAVMTLVFSLGLAIGCASGPAVLDLRSFFGEPSRWLLQERFFLAMVILSNNLRVLFLIAVSGLVVAGPALLLFINGVVIGAVLVQAYARLSPSLLALSILPHGVVEVPAFIYSSAASTAFGLELWRRIIKKEGDLGRAAESYLKGLLVSALLIAVAAFIEAHVTLQLVEASLPP